jgi:hypothetical protein
MTKLTASEIIEIENRHTSGVYAKQPIVFEGNGTVIG